MATPQAVDQYSRFMVDLFDDRDVIGVPGGFGAFFGRPETGARTIFSPDANNIEIDILRGNERLAAMISRGSGRTLSGQKNTTEQKSTNFTRQFPLIEEEGDINVSQLTSRLAGENPYQGRTRIDRLRLLALDHHLEHIRRIGRRHEELAAQSIITGKMTAIDGTTNTDLIYDFKRKSTHLVTVGTAWSDIASDILGDLDDAAELIRADAHVTADMALLSKVDMDSLVKNTAVKSQADNRRFELIEVSTSNPVPPKFARFVEGGLIPRGRIRTPKGFELWLFTYLDVYTSSAGVATDYLPANKTIVAFSGARCDRYFGPPDVMPPTASKAAWFREMFGFNMEAPPMPANIKGTGTIMPAMFHNDAYMAPTGKTVTIRTQSAPIFPTTMTDAFVTITTAP